MINYNVISNLKQKRPRISTYLITRYQHGVWILTDKEQIICLINLILEKNLMKIFKRTTTGTMAKELNEYVKELSELEDYKTREAREREINTVAQKLRRKQFPHNLLYLKHKGKYLGLYSIGDIYEVGLRS